MLKALDKVTLDKMSHKLPGVAVAVSEECTGCGLCEERCIYHAIKVQNGRAEVGEDCMVCGRCANVCPAGAIRVTVRDQDYVEKAIRMISERVDYR